MAGPWAQGVGQSPPWALAGDYSLVLLTVHSPALPDSGKGLVNQLITSVPKFSTPLLTHLPLILLGGPTPHPLDPPHFCVFLGIS